MTRKETEFLTKLLATFKVEAEDHLKQISAGLLELEKKPSFEKEKELIEVVFRETHSFKGAARAVNQMQIESICQLLESIFAAMRRKQISLSRVLLDLLHRTVKLLRQILLSIETAQPPSYELEITELLEQLRHASEGNLPSLEVEPSRASPKSFSGFHAEVPDTIRIRAAKLESVLLDAEELIPLKLGLQQRLTELRELQSSVQFWKKEFASQFPERSDKTNTFIKSLAMKLADVTKSLEHDHRSLNRTATDLLEETKSALLLPFSTLLELLPHVVRELSRDQGKEVELIIEGGELQIDRRILQEMKDPLLHLVRNCIDHGIEKPEQRKRSNKPVCGKILITISRRDGDKVEILIADDGAGIDIATVKAAAVKLGILSAEDAEQLDTQQTFSLIFRSGFTTSRILTDVSGRGLGLAILQEKVEKVGGIISLESGSNGTAFRILLPLSLATFRGIVVRLKDQLFVLPTLNVSRTMRISKDQIKTVENRETVQMNGRTVPLFRLADVLEIPRGPNYSEINKNPAVVIGSAERRTAFLVDEVLHEQEVLVKQLGKQLARVRNIAGATILGTGKVVNILNISDLMKSTLKISVASVQTPVTEKKPKKKAILVVEDSITARTLLKNILESAGYSVTTAVDGLAGFTTLKEGDYALVVTDVDMPRMNGFDLTAKIRSDKKLSETPVVLVTALESQEDRERGIDVGANAYIVKSSFDQSNLLKTIRRLV